MLELKKGKIRKRWEKRKKEGVKREKMCKLRRTSEKSEERRDTGIQGYGIADLVHFLRIRFLKYGSGSG